MIDDPLPAHWQELQNGVCRLFSEVGLTAGVEVPLRTPRGIVTVDVHAIDEGSVDRIQYIAECKNWAHPVPQQVVMSFTTVMHETGANIGFVVTRVGMQSGAEGYLRNTNIVGLTYAELQARYLPLWLKRHFEPEVHIAVDALHQYVEPFNEYRDRLIESLSVAGQERYRQLRDRYTGFAISVLMLDTRYFRTPDMPSGHFVHHDLQTVKRQLTEQTEGEICFVATTYRSLLVEICQKVAEIESQFNDLFGRNIFLPNHTFEAHIRASR
ncbi:MAG: restriction endonuclease [Ralstonia sp.]|uniref:restriction endonuclease n=1 Tax=Ralstonia sp. TaxID=54061 RepID=UPI003F81DD85